MKYGYHIDRFSAGLDEMKRADQGDTFKVLTVLKRIKRFSIFEATENPTIAHMMDSLLARKLIDVDPSPGYPWSNVALTDAGNTLLEKLSTGT